MIHVFLLLAFCADTPASKSNANDTEEIPKYVRRYFERLDKAKEATQSQLKEKLEELTVKIQNISAESRSELIQERAQVEKSLRKLNINQIRAWMPEDAEIGEIGPLQEANVKSVIDKRSMVVEIIVGKDPLFTPNGVYVENSGNTVTVWAVIEKWNTTGYLKNKPISEEELFRLVSETPDSHKLKLARSTERGLEGGKRQSSRNWELERIPRNEIMKWRAQYDKETSLMQKQQAQPSK